MMTPLTKKTCVFASEDIGKTILYLILCTQNVFFVTHYVIHVLTTQTNAKNAPMVCFDILINIVKSFALNLILKIEQTGFVITSPKILLITLDAHRHDIEALRQVFVQPVLMQIVKHVM